MNGRNVLLIVGPTASGKTRLAIAAAARTDGEIISADSRQIYRFMDIGTAKPTAEERRAAPHHLIDLFAPDRSFSAGEYAALAREAVEAVRAKGKQAIVVGGSGLYVRALVDGVFEGKYRDTDIRRRLHERADAEGLGSLHRALSENDPDAARKIHPNDRKRIVRALEVLALTGKPISRMQEQETRSAGFTPVFAGLAWDRKELIRRIDGRVDAMIQQGLVGEVKRLLGMGYGPELNALDSVGYSEVIQHLNGELGLEEAVDLIKRNTRRFAKRQMTWFRRDGRIRWIPMAPDPDWGAVADEMARMLNG